MHRRNPINKYPYRTQNMFKWAKLILQVGIIIYAIFLTIYLIREQTIKEVQASPAVFEHIEDTVFNQYPHYIAENNPVYETYQANNPLMAEDEVIWRINTRLHLPFYSSIPIVDEKPLLVNKQFQLSEDYRPEGLIVINNGHMAVECVWLAFEQMLNDANQEGLNFYVASAYRSYQYQAQLYDSYIEEYGQEAADEFSIRPGHSEHQTGRALDLIGSTGNLEDFYQTPEYPWIKENAHKYGFIIRYEQDHKDITGYQAEPWHITYVGTEIAADLFIKNMTLEEYVGRGLHLDKDVISLSNETFSLPKGQDIVVIDPGHGGNDVGGNSQNATEKSINLAIAKMLEKELTDRGFQTYLLREDDTYIHIAQRVDIANYISPALYVSIHQNSFEDPSVKGVEVWFNSEKEGDSSEKLAQLIHESLIEKTGANGRGYKEDDGYYVIKYTDAPACLVETGFITNDAERDLLLNWQYQEKIANGIAVGIENYFNRKMVYLTFDDGPSEQYTNMILDILQERNIKATFFVVGKNVRRFPETVKRIAEEGHTIGIHCNSHAYKEVYASTEAYVNDFYQAFESVKEITGIEPVLFRFPGGSINNYNKTVYKEIIDEMTSRGFIYYDWNASIEDSYGKYTPDQLVENARKSSAGKKNVVLLGHDIVKETAEALHGIIDLYQEEYSFQKLSPGLTPVQFKIR